MKRYLLLAVGALLAASLSAQTEINGIKLSEGKDKSAYHYYRIRNVAAAEREASATNPYMGLANLGSNWWAAFADDELIKSPYTEYWYFTASKEGNGKVEIKNAVITGSMSIGAKHVTDVCGYSRQNVDFNSKSNAYYLLPAGQEMAFAFSQKATLSDAEDENKCLALTDYVNIRRRIPILNEAGDTLRDDQGNFMYEKYGFHGLNFSDAPLTDASTFILEPANISEVLTAIKEYESQIYPPHTHDFTDPIDGAIQTIDSWKYLTAIFNEPAMEKLTDIRNWLSDWKAEVIKLIPPYTDSEGATKLFNLIDATTQSKLREATALVGNGCIVRLQNQLSLKDLDRFVNNKEEVDERLQLGNAYISAGGDPSYRYKTQLYYMSDDESLEDFAGTGIEPRLEADEKCEWELIPAENSYKFLLYNRATDSYIRKYHDLYEYYGGNDAFLAPREALSEFSWVTTHDKADAAPFFFLACRSVEDQTKLTAEQEGLINAAGLDTEVENKVRLQANYTYEVLNSVTGKIETHETRQLIHRGSAESDYRFYDWGPTFNNWFADSNAFLIETVQMGGINEIAANKPARADGAVYDLQGRRVANPGRGLYIVNGRKTLLR